MVDQPQKTIISSVLHLSRVLRRHPQNSPASSKRFHGQHRILNQIKKNPGITAAELASNLDIRPASASEAVKRLEEAKLLVKKAVPEDKRKQGLYLTEKGQQVIEHNREAREKDLDAIKEILNEEERETFISLSEKLIDGLHKRRDADWQD